MKRGGYSYLFFVLILLCVAGCGKLQEGSFEKREQALQNTFEQNPQDFESYKNLVNLYIRNHDFELAKQLLQEHGSLFEEAWILRKRGNILLVEGDLDGAEKLYSKVLELEPNSAFTHASFGHLNLKRGKYEEAQINFDTSVAIEETASALYGLGRIYLANGSLQEAELFANQALELNSTGAIGLLGQIYSKQGNWDRAEEMYLRLLNLYPNQATSYSGLGNVYYQKEEYDKAEKMYLQAIERKPNEYIYNGLRLVYEAQGEDEKAELMLKKALEINPNIPT